MAGLSSETQNSIAASAMFPGFRFSPTDVELISYYLKKKLEGLEKCVEVIPEVEICKYEPWDLPAKSIIQSENEWFFFSARGRKYPNGSQSRRATELGYWKATGKERNIKSGNEVIGTKRTLVFHKGRAPKGERTEWIMHEYCMEGRSQDSLVICRLRKNADFRLNSTSNQNSLRMRSSNYAVSEGGTDQTGMSEGDKAFESSSKKCSSSHDSYSIEQIDSASESEQKLANDVTLTESSARNKDLDYEDDYFAEILEDDIIKLDEAPLFATSVAASNPNPEAAGTSKQYVEGAIPLQGTANRRIKLRKLKSGLSRFGVNSVERNKSQNTEPQPPKCRVTLWGRTFHSGAVSIVYCMLTLLAVFLYMYGGFWPVKALSRLTFKKDFWH
uniref:NAC transcription factor 73 n=1 Tax=Litchi chinensis TaxID=151069 RepID=A0A8K1HZE9_LITCN|nr:NAC transcription factor 73 [Litchi chinensis]